MIGVIYALWATGRHKTEESIGDRIAKAAAARTNTLSRAWLRAASCGEAAAPWHNLVGAIIRADAYKVAEGVREVMKMGSSSGADALAGFIAASLSLDTVE